MRNHARAGRPRVSDRPASLYLLGRHSISSRVSGLDHAGGGVG
jgi:hypothetical protein